MPRQIELTLGATAHGLMFYDPADDCAGQALRKYVEYSPHEVEIFHYYAPFNIALDIGANIGALTLPLARVSKELHAFEPDLGRFRILNANLGINQYSHVKTYNYPVGSFANPIDSLSLEGCDFIKLDVDGPELEVLEGAKETIRKYAPIIYMENDRKWDAANRIRYMYSINYLPMWHPTLLCRDTNYAGEPLQKSDLTAVTIMMLCLPLFGPRTYRIPTTLIRAQPEDVDKCFFPGVGNSVGSFNFSALFTNPQ